MIALHGDFASGFSMCRDINWKLSPCVCPTIPLNTYRRHGVFQWWQDHGDTFLMSKIRESQSIMCYSRSGSLITGLAANGHLPNLRNLVLYECPIRQEYEFGLDVLFDLRVLIIWNDKSKRSRAGKSPMAQLTERLWMESGASVSLASDFGWRGRLRHVERKRGRFAHGWDTSLNGRIHSWLTKQPYSKTRGIVKRVLDSLRSK